jgi:predicted flap endonuclease-1-like 5' DNA nuclease
MKLIEIIGLEEKHAKLLEKEGINSVEELIPLNYNQIRKLARKIGVSVKLLDTWQEHADLMRVEGISPKLANALNLIGIDSLKELAFRNSKSTFEKLKVLKKENLKVITKIPTLKILEDLINKAKKIAEITPKDDKVKKKPSPKKKSVPKESSAPDIPITSDYKPFEKFEKNYGKYSSEYWNSKWKTAPIIYTGRALRGESYKKQIDVDVKAFIKENDAILWHVITQAGLRKDRPNETALAIQNFVCNFLKYKYDDETVDCPEFWLFPFESIQSGIGDCEDGAILIAGLLINAGIPNWRVKVCAAQVFADPIFAPSDTELGGHAYCIYLADREESERKLEWVILDWCYLQDPEIPIKEKPLARNGGQAGAYREVWFTFNDENSWAQSSFEVREGRISKNRITKKEDVLTPLEDILKHLASDELMKVFKKYNIEIE